jgi:type I restriction enzyme S subunit
MKKYNKYKQSGIEWIGEIPEHWESTKLKFFGESIIGIIYSPDDVVNTGEGLLVLRSSNIQDGKLAFEDCVFVNKEVQEKYLTKEGDILLCARNGSAHLVGKAANIDKQNEGVTFGTFMSIVRSELEKYLFYFFNSQVFKAQTGLFSTSTINQLTSSTLNNMIISFPRDKHEQTAIADYLDQKTAEIDELITDKKCLLELYEEEKTAVINHAVTKGLTADGKGLNDHADENNPNAKQSITKISGSDSKNEGQWYRMARRNSGALGGETIKIFRILPKRYKY